MCFVFIRGYLVDVFVSISGYVMTEVCSSPSKANDNYKSKMVNVILCSCNLHVDNYPTVVKLPYFGGKL